MYHYYVDLILGKQDGLDLNGDFNQFKPPSHGLYLLGTLPEDGFMQSISALGEVMCSKPSTPCNTTKKEGQLKFFLLRAKDGSFEVVDVYNLDTSQTKDMSRPLSKKDFINEKHPIKGDLMAIYILNNPVKKSAKNKWYRLQVNVFHNNSNYESQYKFFRGSNNTKGEKIQNIKNKISNIVRNGNMNSWMAVDRNLEFNVQVKIKRTQ